MTQRKQDGSSALVKVRGDLIREGPRSLARRALDDFARLKAQPPITPECIPFHTLYAAGDKGIDDLFHACVRVALETKRHIFPTLSCCEQEIRHLWTQRQFNCVFLLLNNIIPQHVRRNALKSGLALIPWLRERSSATIIAFCGLRRNPSEIERQALLGGANRFFLLPCQPSEVIEFLKERFAGPTGP